MSLVCSDQTNIYCGLKGGIVLVFLADTLLFVTRLEEKNSHLWQLQVMMVMMMVMMVMVMMMIVMVICWAKAGSGSCKPSICS